MKSEKSCDKIPFLRHELEMDKLRMKIHELEKEKSDHLKGIERLKKRAADSDYYKEKSELLEEKYIARGKDIDHLLSENKEKDKKISELEEKLKEANKLADSWKRDYEFVRDQLIHPIYDILYPDNPNRDINVTDFINNVKDLKVYENKSMYEDLKYWRERCHGAETDVTTLNSKVETLKNKNTELNQALLITIKEMCKDE